MDKDIFIYHKDWSGRCIIKGELIFRENNGDDNGKYIFKNNELLIKWEKWEEEYFIKINNMYVDKKYIHNISKIYLLKKNEKIEIYYDNFKKDFIKNNITSTENVIVYNKNIYKKYLENIFIYENEETYFFYIDTVNFNKKTRYILNKLDNTFFEYTNTKNEGVYSAENNIVYLKFKNGIEKKFLSNIYYEENNINYENIKIIRPNNFKIENKILFSNITLIDNKIYLTSIYYQYNPWKMNNLKINIYDNTMIKKNIIEYNNYESCLLIELELEKVKNNVSIEIIYNDYKKKMNLHQLNLPKNNIYAVTLFKDDYQLLKKYLEYYNNLGVNCFYFYYNNKISEDFINEINIINQSKYEIILVEWDYDYWHINKGKTKHHHSQTMAINDSLYTLKHFCNYILYNDLDEYIKMDYSFEKLIENNNNVDVFQFKCMFCKMGTDLIKYRNFYFEYDEKKVIKGNFWDKYREKNLIKASSVNLMGVHNPVLEYSKKELVIEYVSYFYHFINFYEKNREELMTKYIS